jgi:ATP-dependent Clp protease ATP-binding subunit ClpC
MLDRFSDRARSAVSVAELEARRMGHHHIGTEHLLLGILSEADGDEATAIRAQGATLDAAREKVVEAVGTKLDTSDGDPQFTARARRALERASRFSLQRLDEHVDIEHVLLGVLDVEGTACQVLRRLGVDVAGLRRAVDSVPTEPTRTPEPQPVRVAGLSPRCPSCGEVLATVLNHRVLTATDEAGTQRDMIVAFCAACGAALGATPA